MGAQATPSMAGGNENINLDNIRVKIEISRDENELAEQLAKIEKQIAETQESTTVTEGVDAANSIRDNANADIAQGSLVISGEALSGLHSIVKNQSSQRATLDTQSENINAWDKAFKDKAQGKVELDNTDEEKNPEEARFNQATKGVDLANKQVQSAQSDADEAEEKVKTQKARLKSAEENYKAAVDANADPVQVSVLKNLRNAEQENLNTAESDVKVAQDKLVGAKKIADERKTVLEGIGKEVDAKMNCLKDIKFSETKPTPEQLKALELASKLKNDGIDDLYPKTKERFDKAADKADKARESFNSDIERVNQRIRMMFQQAFAPLLKAFFEERSAADTQKQYEMKALEGLLNQIMTLLSKCSDTLNSQVNDIKERIQRDFQSHDPLRQVQIGA